MEKLLDLLKDCNTRTVEELAVLLDTSVEDVKRKMEFLENTGMIKDSSILAKEKEKSCGNCNGCNGCKGCEGGHAACKGCIPPDAGMNMGKVWEVVRH